MSYQRYTDKEGKIFRVQQTAWKAGRKAFDFEIAEEKGVGKNWLYEPIKEEEIKEKVKNGELIKL